MVIQVRTQLTSMLPIRDVMLPTPKSRDSEVSVQPGAVFFSGAVERAPIGIEQLYAADVSLPRFQAVKMSGSQVDANQLN